MEGQGGGGGPAATGVPKRIDVPRHVHDAPQLPKAIKKVPPVVFALNPGALILLVLGYGLVCAGDALIQVIDPAVSYDAIQPEFCTYYDYKPGIPAGKRARIKIEGNQTTTPVGAVEIFVTPPAGVLPAAGDDPRTTFGGDGDTSVRGPGVLTIHLKTNTPPPKIEVWIED